MSSSSIHAPLSLPAAPEILQITWEPQTLPIPADETTQLVAKLKTTIEKYFPGVQVYEWTDTTQVTMAEFFQQIQQILLAHLNQQIQQCQHALLLVEERQKASSALQEAALLWIKDSVQLSVQDLKNSLQADILGSSSDEMVGIEWTSPVMPPNYVTEIQTAINDGRLTIKRLPTPKPPSRTSSRTAIRSRRQMSKSPFDSFTPKPRPSAHKENLAAPTPLRPYGLSPLPPGTGGPQGLFGFGTRPQTQAAPPPSLFSGPYGQRQESESPIPIRTPTPSPPRPQQQGSGNGGQKPPRNPPAGASGAPSGDPDGSDSEPEGSDPKAWRRYFRKQMQKSEDKWMDRLSKQLKASGYPQVADPTPRRRDPKAPPPSKFKGQAEDVERFIRQCKNVFSIEQSSFTEETVNIRYAGNLMDGMAPTKWYKAYHNSIDEAATTRLAGGRPVTLDPAYAQWSTFVQSFKDAFGEAISRDAAVAQWESLQHTEASGIVGFLNSIIQLMWKTGYDGDKVDDKINGALLQDIGLQWAIFNPKPATLMEQIAALRELGHTYERYQKRKKVVPTGPRRTRAEKPAPARNQLPLLAGQPAAVPGTGKPARKDKAVELKGIPESILAERKETNMCLKCGKSPHKWYDCWTRDLVTVRVASVQRKRKSLVPPGAPTGPKRSRVAEVLGMEGEALMSEGSFVLDAEEEKVDSEDEILGYN